MAKTFTFAAQSDFWNNDNTGWIYDFASGAIRPAPTSFGVSRVTSSSNTNPLTVKTLTSIETFDYELRGSIAINREGTSTYSGGMWHADYLETVDLGKTKISSISPRSFGFGDDTISINFGGLVSYSLIGGKTLGQMVANGDTIVGSQLNDTLATTNYWEIVRAGSGNDVISSRGGNDILYGDAGNDVLNGGAGADQMRGGLGDDRFFVDSVGDKVFEAANQGTDTVLSSVSYALAAGQHIESLGTNAIAGTGAIHLTGNELAQRINGNNGGNSLSGLAGNDVLVGNGGNDWLKGGTGNDTLTGGSGSDNFIFDTALNPATNVDRITDFNVAADTIRLDNAVMSGLGTTLGTLAAAKFWKNTTGLAHDANDRIIYETDTGKLFYDSNGNAAGGAVHFATLAANLALTHLDFHVM